MAMPAETGLRERGHSTNLVGIPTALLASEAFNDHPLSLAIAGARELHPHLFRRLDTCSDLATASAAFQDYMDVAFSLRREDDLPEDGRPRRYRSSYLRLLKGWGHDSNGREGAVLKGWVESRFGLFPTFHKEPILKFSSPAWIHYVEEKMASRFHNNAIHAQLDLLYEYCQWALARFLAPSKRHLRLFRGVINFTEHQLIERRAGRERLIRLNNLVSFTQDRDIATQFGDFILESSVPVPKILFLNDLLARHPLRGEGEYLVIGGDYRVSASYV